MTSVAQTVEWTVSAEDEARAHFYALIARLFCAAPDADLLARLARADEIVAEDEDAVLAAAWNRLCRASAAADADAVREEYEGLFVGIGRPQVMLYGSYYLAGFLMEKPLAQLRDDLAEMGLARKAGVGESEDHIAALAEVMRYLIAGDVPDPARRLALQQRFFLRHIKPWYAKLCETVEAVAGANFYVGIVGFARAFLDVEAESFGFDL